MRKIYAAINNGQLRKYNLAAAQVGDKVLGFDPGKVIAFHQGRVVFGWDSGLVNSYAEQDDYTIYLAPLAWVEDRPVYAGDVLYSKSLGEASGKLVAKRMSGCGQHLELESIKPEGFVTHRPDTLTWTKPVTTIKINGHDVPAPERVAPPVDTKYWIPSVRHVDEYDWFDWQDLDTDRLYLSRGLVHLTEEAAVAHAKALLSFTEVCDA